MELFFAFSGSSTATSTSEQEPALAKRKSATGSLYDATRSQARHSATTACSSSATALFTVSNIRCLALCATPMFAYREIARNGLGDRLRRGANFLISVHETGASIPRTGSRNMIRTHAASAKIVSDLSDASPRMGCTTGLDNVPAI